MIPPPHAHYDSVHYPDTIRLERGCMLGMTPEEVAEKEAAFALRAAGLDDARRFARSGVLDLACGAGDHLLAMHRMLGGAVRVRGIDLSANLVDLARRKSIGLPRIEVARGDVTALAPAPLGAEGYRLVTILGHSLGDMGLRSIRRVLAACRELLEVDGRLVVQFRQRAADASEIRTRDVRAARERLGMSVEPIVVSGQRTSLYRDLRRGDGCYSLSEDCPCPDGDHCEEYVMERARSEDREYSQWRERETGLTFAAFRRVYVDPQGGTHELPITMVNSLLWEEEFARAKALFEQAGFAGVTLEGPRDEEEYVGDRRLIAIVARTR
jgi:SAM-dependent methyltransferase